MGRELKRVALDFVWNLNSVWKGYINPHGTDRERKPCPFCTHGSTPEAHELQERWYGNAPFKPEDRGSTSYLCTDPIVVKMATLNVLRARDYYGSGQTPIDNEAIRLSNLFNSRWMHHLNQDDVKALVKANRLYDFTHTWTAGKGWKKKKNFVMPTAKEVNDWSLVGMGHDSINSHVVIRAECKRLGMISTCPHCKGHGVLWITKAAKKKYDEWKEIEPPAGNGYQIWETVSEGSPVSPVFYRPEDLAQWMVKNDTSITKDTGYDGWMKFILGDGWAPTMVGIGNQLMSGVGAQNELK